MNLDFQKYLLEKTGASSCRKLELIQSLWSGYGQILRYQLEDSAYQTVVVKHIAGQAAEKHPRGWHSDHGHQRKLKSYEVEGFWYKHWNSRCDASCRTAEMIGSYNQGEEQWIVLEDLDHQFPLRIDHPGVSEVKLGLRWLAGFHAKFINQAPEGLWEVGSYWHLATRPDEFEKITHAALKSQAQAIDDTLSNCEFQTIVHGDAKLANFCFNVGAEAVAAVDFQYVGRGCGMKDVSYFIGSCLSSEDCERYQDELLESYFSDLHGQLTLTCPTIDSQALEAEWRAMYPIAWTDFTRFLLGWMPSHQKINDYSYRLMTEVLKGLG